jgi:hypothetical protein
VVFESFFGNTARIARAVGAGLELEGWSVSVRDISDPEPIDLQEVDLLVVGAPTHAFSLSRRSTREDAAGRGGRDSYAEGGMREWLGRLPASTGSRLAAVFDTRVSKVRRLPASAGRSAGRILRSSGYRLVQKPHGFIVRDVQGPLESHQVEEALDWGRSVARAAQVDHAALQID